MSLDTDKYLDETCCDDETSICSNAGFVK